MPYLSYLVWTRGVANSIINICFIFFGIQMSHFRRAIWLDGIFSNQMALFWNLPNPSFIKYGVLWKFCSRFSRTSSREFSLIYFFISFSIFESTLVSLYSSSGLDDPWGLPITVQGFPRKSLCNRSQLEDLKSLIASQLVHGRLAGELCKSPTVRVRGAPTLYFVYPFYDILFQKTSIFDFYRDLHWTEGHCFH